MAVKEKGKRIIRVNFFRGDSLANTMNNNLDSREYDYFFVDDDVEIKDDSYAVVAVGTTLKIVKVVKEAKVSGKATKFAIAVFSLTEHEERIEIQKNIQELEEAIIARAKTAEKRAQINKLITSKFAYSYKLTKSLSQHSTTISVSAARNNNIRFT